MSSINLIILLFVCLIFLVFHILNRLDIQDLAFKKIQDDLQELQYTIGNKLDKLVEELNE